MSVFQAAGYESFSEALMQSYVQADIEGQAIVWLMPHCVAQVLPKDVDFRVMLTFLEFYHTLLQFILFKLYHRLGLKYPPGMPEEVEHAAAELQVIIKEVAGLQDGEVAKRGEEAAGLTCAVLEFGFQLCVPNPFFCLWCLGLRGFLPWFAIFDHAFLVTCRAKGSHL
jgi:hypothetical protein